MSSSTSGSHWKSVDNEFRNKVDNIFHKYPKLPKTLPREDRPNVTSYPLNVTLYGYSLPLRIGSEVSVKNYNTFLDRNEKTGYKFSWDEGNVYIIEMAIPEHEAVVSYLQDCFKEPNNGVRRGPIRVYGSPYHYNPIRYGEKIAPDVAVRPSNAHVLQPLIRHPGPPPSDMNGRAHARVICEIGNSQTIISWNERCELWMREEYVRCVLGIKLFSKKIIGETVHRQMIARLWTRVVQGGGELSSNATLARAGVYVKEWDFGTIQYNNNAPTPTGCNALNLNAFQITIPIADAFYDPPIVGGVPTPYAILVPGTVVGVNFVIDLFDVQQVVLESQ
ncbi:hypothetical protein Glove_165g7 [Diversispora epigaea]|uniref:Uncharacterized protein n=1 Tax=Diversispora epigaea TaxID=1348612 RepID=A0A397IQT8_9GLOM|nr:hypothetical protein Glove_165g7 [Diversispora epigaea]